MKPATCALLFVVGVVGVVVAVGFLFVGFSFCTLINPALPPGERRRQFLENVFLDNAAGLVVLGGLLNVSLLLCVKAAASREATFERTWLHLLISSAITAGLIGLMLVPFLWKFG